MTLSHDDTNHLIDSLRRSLLYQTPVPIFVMPNDPPDHFLVRIKREHYADIMSLIGRAGGWELNNRQKLEVLRKHEERARRAYGDGVNYDFGDLPRADLLVMFQETSGIAEFAMFHEALACALTQAQEPVQ
jgi:hypothetical protein